MYSVKFYLLHFQYLLLNHNKVVKERELSNFGGGRARVSEARIEHKRFEDHFPTEAGPIKLVLIV